MEKNKIMTAEDLLAKLRAGVKEVYEIRLRELTVPVRVLSVDEINEVRKEALRYSAGRGGDETDRSLMIQKSTLKLASNITRTGGPLLGDKLLGLLSVDEINFLYEEYIRVLDAVNPSLESIPADQFRALVEALKKNTLTPKDLSLHQLKAICSSYADLIRRLETQDSRQGNLSGGQP